MRIVCPKAMHLAVKHLKRASTAARNAVNRWTYRRFTTTHALAGSAVLLDQEHGLSLDGNLHYIARELSNVDEYGGLSLYFSVSRQNLKRFKSLATQRGLAVTPVIRPSRRYYRILATSKYLVTDTSFPLVFAKRTGQVLWNTWHGTPLKTLGRSETKEAHLIGNVQKNFAQADYISFPNEYTAERITDDYMLRGICQATLLFAEYPRNEPFATPASSDVRNRYIPLGMVAYAYLPTFRFSPEEDSKTASLDAIARHLGEIDQALGARETLYVKLHPAIIGSLPLDSYAHIEPVPSDIELYEFLNLCDALVTDYSSVMFDFAITRKKVVLFTFDKDQYLTDRGLYRTLNSLPFSQVNDVQSLMRELRSESQRDYGPIAAEMSPYDAHGTTGRLCQRVFKEEAGEVVERRLAAPEELPVLALIDRLPPNNELEAFNRELLDLAGQSTIYLAFPCSSAAGRIDFLAALSPRINFIPYAGRMALGPLEALSLLARRIGALSDETCRRMTERSFAFEALRLFGDASFSDVVCLSSDWHSTQIARHVKVPGRNTEHAIPR